MGFLPSTKNCRFPVKNYNDDVEEMLLGNVIHVWRFPQPDYSKSLDEDKARFPLVDLVSDWWESRPQTMRDKDGWELLRAEIASTAATARWQQRAGRQKERMGEGGTTVRENPHRLSS